MRTLPLGALVDTDDARTAAGGEAEEDGLHQDAHRVRADALRDAHGRHQIKEVKIWLFRLFSAH